MARGLKLSESGDKIVLDLADPLATLLNNTFISTILQSCVNRGCIMIMDANHAVTMKTSIKIKLTISLHSAS